MELAGSPVTGDLRTWEVQQRRLGGYVAIGLALALVIVGVAAWLVAGDVPWLNWTLVVLLVLVLAFVVALLAMGAKAEPAPGVESGHPHPGPAAPASMMGQPEPPAPQVKMITLRCGDCGTVFDIEDTGQRPLFHTCPGCGAEGVLKDPTPAPSAAAPAPPPAPAPEQTQVERPPVVAPSPTPAPRRLKLRCGGCKEVFVIEDSGERPLRRPCPYCGRMGEIR